MIKTEFANDRDSLVHMEKMEMGEYAILIDFDWSSEMAAREFVLSSYGKQQVVFYED